MKNFFVLRHRDVASSRNSGDFIRLAYGYTIKDNPEYLYKIQLVRGGSVIGRVNPYIHPDDLSALTVAWADLRAEVDSLD